LDELGFADDEEVDAPLWPAWAEFAGPAETANASAKDALMFSHFIDRRLTNGR